MNSGISHEGRLAVNFPGRACMVRHRVAFVAEFVDAQVVKTLGFLGVVGSSPTARAVLRLRAVAEQTQIGRCPLC